MSVSFKTGPAAQIASFAAFDGIKRTCTKFEKVRVKGKLALRCAKYREGRGSPVCDTRLVDGGRSPGLVRKTKCSKGGGGTKRKSSKRKAKR